jgi:hypothetical protein
MYITMTKKYFDIKEVNFDITIQKGTCVLESNKNNCKFRMIWSIQNYPTELPSMPGAPYSVQVNFTIFDDNNIVNSMSGLIIYKINTGTLPTYSDLGIPFGKYCSVAFNNKYGDTEVIKFNLNQNYMIVCIKD